jgi:hypothetical protein
MAPVPASGPTEWFWQLVHPCIKALAKPRFDAGFFGDAVETSFKEIIDAVKLIVKEGTGKELDGNEAPDERRVFGAYFRKTHNGMPIGDGHLRCCRHIG